MEKRLILRGVLSGLVAGALAFVFARILAEPQIQAAISYESGRDAAQDALDRAAGVSVPAAGPDIFSRGIQANLGIGVGMILFGAAMGALFTVVYIYCVGRVGAVRPRQLSLLVAAAGFVGLFLVPFLKYPANPPAIGHEETIRARGTLYLVMVVCSVGLLALSVWLGQRLSARFGTWNAALLAGSAFVLAIGTVMFLLPPLGHLAYNRANFGDHATETPLPLRDPDGSIVFPGFPADVLATFRLYSVAAQIVLWAVIGVLFAPMAERLLSPEQAPGPVPSLVD